MDDLVVSNVFEQVDDVLYKSVSRGDPRIALSFGRELMKGAGLRGVALAKLLWSIQDKWSLFQAAGVDDTCINVIKSETGIATGTFMKYSRLWEVIFVKSGISENLKQRLLQKPVRDLILLPALVEEGDVDWEELIPATHEEIRKIIKAKRGEATSSKTAVYIRLDRNTGGLSAKRGDEPFTPFGILNLDKAKESATVANAIERIVRDARIIEL